MSIYITELKKQHVQIKELLQNVHSYIISNESKKQFINELQELLSNHIETEDKELYRVLVKESENNIALKRKLDLFAKGWEEVSIFVNYYITKYSTNIDNDFLKDTGQLLAKIKNRILKEEMQLFPEYDKILS